MKPASPFGRVAKLPALDAFCRRIPPAAGAARPSGEAPACLHATVKGLLGAANSLAVGAVALGRSEAEGAPKPVVVLAVVEGPEAALDLLADLRAFRAVEESEAGAHEATRPHAQAIDPPAHGKRARGKPSNPQSAIRNPKSEAWADPDRPPEASLPEDLKRGLRLETLLFPAWDVLPTESDRPEGLTLAGRRRAVERLKALNDPAEPQPEALIAIAPVAALLQPVEAPGEADDALVLRPKASHDPILLGRKLVEMGFERTAQVEVRGEFSLRGGILDVFPYTSERPFRIDFFGDEIESIRPFDPLTQRSEEPVAGVRLVDSSPARLKKLFSPGGSGGPWTLLDHLPPGAAVVWEHPERLRQRAELFSASLVSGRSHCVGYETLRARAAERFDTLDLRPPAGAGGERLGRGFRPARRDGGGRGPLHFRTAPAGRDRPARRGLEEARRGAHGRLRLL
ncbi:MAG: hypothetical protein M5U26_06930 [Planctomycetota bacterium]|nr:hypothetical protein [Planctomycetota bacterium]